MAIKLPYYTTRDYTVLALVLLPITLIINLVLLGKRYYADAGSFLAATCITSLAFALCFVLSGAWAVLMKRRFPEENQMGARFTAMTLTFFAINGFLLYSLFKLYEWMPLFRQEFNESNFTMAYTGMCIVNVFLTLVMEGIDRYEKWHASMEETDAMRKVFQQTQLQGLKSQLNPHFLFNSLNSLSSLIADDEEKAETFLNEMSKVYRYMLRNDEEQLVTVDTELQFIASYFYLLHARYGEGLQLKVDVSQAARQSWLPPLSLQILLENAFTQNSISKIKPLCILIQSVGDAWLEVRNNLQPKIINNTSDLEANIDLLVSKYRLLNSGEVSIEDHITERVVRLPLIMRHEEVEA